MNLTNGKKINVTSMAEVFDPHTKYGHNLRNDLSFNILRHETVVNHV